MQICNHIKWQEGFFLATLVLFLTFPQKLFSESIKNNIFNKVSVESLSLDPTWLALGHYSKNSVLPGYTSFIDSKNFFISNSGKYSPQKELEATVNKFITDSNYICKYPARYEFLSKKLPISRYIKARECRDFKEWLDIINPKGVTLIFPSSFVSNPASAFGHTLIRLDEAQEDERAALYSYSINFSAQTYGEPGLLYAFKGIFGGYNGYFSIAPYYKLVKKYSDLEKRDIWEYGLNLTKKEVFFLTRHIWELREVNFSYYYFDENCSYHLLGLLDVARPSLALRSKFPFVVIPGDTVKEIIEDTGLLKKQVFRPSIETKFTTRIDETDINIQRISKKIIDTNNIKVEEIENLNIVDKAKTYDLAYDYLEHLMLKDKIDPKISDPLALKLLKTRSKLPYRSKPLTPDKRANPLDTHDSKKISYEVGSIKNKVYQNLSLRNAYHGLIDKPDGFILGSSLEFINVGFRQIEEQDLKLNYLDLLNINSLSQKNLFLNPISWNFYSGLSRRDTKRKEQKLVYENNLYLGSSSKIINSTVVYLLAGASSKLSNNYHANNATGLGVNAGLVSYLSDKLALKIDVKTNRYWLGEEHRDLNLSSEIRYSINNSLDLNLEFKRKKDYQEYFNDYSLSLSYFF